MGIKDKIQKKIKNRVLKKTLKDKVSSLISDEKAREVASDLIKEGEGSDSGTGEEEDSWLEEKAQEAEDNMEEDDGPVTGLDDMEKRIQDMKDKTDEAEEDR